MSCSVVDSIIFMMSFCCCSRRSRLSGLTSWEIQKRDKKGRGSESEERAAGERPKEEYALPNPERLMMRLGSPFISFIPGTPLLPPPFPLASSTSVYMCYLISNQSFLCDLCVRECSFTVAPTSCWSPAACTDDSYLHFGD